MFRLVLLLLLALTNSALAANCKLDEPFKRVTLDEDNFYIAVLRLNGRPVWDGLDVYNVDDHLLVPVSLLVDAMGLNWNIDIPTNNIASQGAESHCDFDIQFSSTSTNSRDFLYWSKDDFDLYIDVNALPALLPVSYEFDDSLLVLSLTSNDIEFIDTTEPQLIVPTFYKKDTESIDRVIDDTYHFYTSPLFSYRVVAQDRNAQSERLSVNINAGFDLLKHETNFRMSRVRDTSQHFLRLTRTLEDTATLLSERGLTYELGDIQLIGDNVVTSPSQSLGFLVHNGDDKGRRNFSKTTIEEFVLPGWRVQLFRNGQFIDEKFSDDQNKVLFEDIDTFYGNNFFELKLYGPEGQQETRNQTVSVGQEQTQKGDIDFSFGVNDNNYRLLDGKVSESGLGKSVLAKVGVGLTDDTSISGTYQRLWLNDTPLDYYTSAIDTQFKGSALHVSLTQQEQGGYATFVGWNGRINQDVVFNFSNRHLSDFVSQRYGENSLIENETTARINGQTELFGRLGWNANLSYRTFKRTDDNASLGLNINNNLLGGTFSGGVVLGKNTAEPVTGRLYYSKQIEGWQVASAWDFVPSDGFNTDTFYVALRWPYLLSQHRETRLQYRASGTNNLEVQHQHNWTFDFVNVGLGGTLGEDGDWSINLTFTGNINYNPYSRAFNFDRAATPAAGRIDAFAFLDANRNNQFDSNEQPLEGVNFKGNSQWRNDYTNEEGKARIITSHNFQTLSIDSASLPDLYMIAADNNVEVLTHSGGVNQVNLPVHTISDVEGTLFLVSEQQSRGAPRVQLNIVDESGHNVATTYTESDGYFYVTQLPPGEYELEIDEGYLQRNALSVSSNSLSFIAPTEGDSIYLDDIKLIKSIESSQGLQLDDDSQFTESSIIDADVKYEIQIGIFRHARSISEVVRHLPTTPSSMQYYRNHRLAMTYVTVGGFTSITDASLFLEAIQSHVAFSNAFISPVTRYEGEDWTRETVVYEFDEKIEESQRALAKSLPKQICQLSAYYSKASVNPQILILHPELLLVPNSPADATFYRLLAPVNENGTCVDDYLDHQYRDAPFMIRAANVLH
ncbi:carboxypeptidase-like regulatory domain-containing protein [Alteromonas sp. McT4-15]|uniref:carboxypeptidase-like regulatory domain-containing protein n=1 Tax=Alteromonas sp. McT4-15 TaxID=2881256 RepID=UPI001CF868E5|nr:carboxypeptidase-like regulatory domain-containing protein [Alteromonas sp. McT4-15]MCB4435377.1 carboxypeptidase-like regulatory domain-containing protein [Alteromonas sp. McT4-15]